MNSSLDALDNIHHCRIFPGIGIARVGNSPSEYYVGPESPGLLHPPENGYKDKTGRVKRQAARFRIYAYSAEDEILKEVTAEDATIEWQVHLCNKKAAHTRFQGRFNIKGAALRNPATQDRNRLIIDPGEQTIAGKDKKGTPFAGIFRPTMGDSNPEVRVPLGELRTDRAGRLLVLGGFGKSGSVAQKPNITNYANNDFWYDDVSDGPVTAKVTLKDGRELPVIVTSWIIVTPPKFAPQLLPITSLYDVMEEVAITQHHTLQPKANISFKEDIYPLLYRLINYRWVNTISLRGHGPRKPGDFLAELATLARKSEQAKSRRQYILSRVRDPNFDLKSDEAKAQANGDFMPPLGGDGGDPQKDVAASWQRILKTQYANLKRWAEGDFKDDWDGNPPIVRLFKDIPLSEQPEALNRAALEPCIGGPWFPGIEMTYIAQFNGEDGEGPPTIYHPTEPFRLDCQKLKPGELTQYMALPWQADFNECAEHWWPVQRPDHVVTEALYQEVVEELRDVTPISDPVLPDKLAARSAWARGLATNPGETADPDYFDPTQVRVQYGDLDMVEHWSELGFVVRRQAPNGDEVFIETERSPYVGLSEREYFHIMMNIDEHPDFLPKAKLLADSFLNEAWELRNDPAEDNELIFFSYSKDAFDARLQLIYGHVLAQGRLYDPSTDPVYRTREHVIERQRQLAPFNQLDGIWLRNVVSRGGPLDEVRATLFSIWSDELGNGNPEHNHANVYTSLLQDCGIYLPPIQSSEYASNPGFLDSAFSVPLFLLVISQFSEDYLPEILGMTLMLEWEVLNLWISVKRLNYFGLNPLFYQMHIGIDNAANGHGALARRAVELYLDQVRAQSGEEGVQQAWERVWRGYVAFRKTGNLAPDLISRFLPTQTVGDALQSIKAIGDTSQPIQSPRSLDARMVDMIERKRPYAQFNHGDKMLGSKRLNNWFDQPYDLLGELQNSGLIIPGDPKNSPFFRLLSFEGPMYQVFTSDEIRLWEEWTLSLAKPSIDGIDPVDGALEGGEEAKITGRGFLDGCTITFGRVKANVVEVKPNELRVKVPSAEAAGYKASDDSRNGCFAIVRLTNPDNQTTPTDAVFRYRPNGISNSDRTFLGPTLDPPLPILGPAELMKKAIRYMRVLQKGTPGHEVALVGPDPADDKSTVRNPIAWWFEQDEIALMSALNDQRNGWIVPRNAGQSPLVTSLVSGGSAMAKALRAIVPGTEHMTSREVALALGAGDSAPPAAVMPRDQGLTYAEVINLWINAGCPLEDKPVAPPEKPVERTRPAAVAAEAIVPVQPLDVGGSIDAAAAQAGPTNLVASAALAALDGIEAAVSRTRLSFPKRERITKGMGTVH